MLVAFALVRSAEKIPSGVDDREADAARGSEGADRVLRAQYAAAVRLAAVAVRTYDRFPELQPRSLFAAALTAACVSPTPQQAQRQPRRWASSTGWHVRASLRFTRVCVALFQLADVEGFFRVGSVGSRECGLTLLWASARAGCSRNDSAAEFGGSGARRREGGAARRHVGSAARRCAGARVLYHVVHEGLAAERTSPGRAQPSPDFSGCK